MLRFTFLLSLVFFQCVTLLSQDRLSGKSFTSRSEVLARNGMVATNHPLATQIALDILKQGGSAVDAAIAANAFLGLADPGMCGIGGDLFAIVWDAGSKKLYGLNGSGRSPKNQTMALLKQKGISELPPTGALSITVPGCVDGWFTLHKRFGKLPMDKLLSPTVKYAREGIPITQETSDFMEEHLRDMLKFDESGKHPSFEKFFMANGRFPRKGEIFKNEELASSLETIAQGGRDGYYKGRIAKAIASHIQKEGGFLTADDLATHTSQWVEPISTNYRGYDVWEMPPNSQGFAVLQMLNILEGYDIRSFGFGSARHIHYLVEAKKIAYQDLATYCGDPDFNKIPIDSLCSKRYADEKRKLIRPDKAGPVTRTVSSGNHTIYLTVADKDGNMVSFIQSNSGIFGSMEVPAGLGFVLQNRAAFKFDQGHINGYAPGKRPFHTIIPAFITKDGKPFVSFGLMGGSMQPQGHAQMILNIIDFGMNLQEAGDAPRISHRGGNDGTINNVGEVNLESGFSYESVRELLKFGHKVGYGYGVFGGYQAIMLKDGIYYGASDSRKDGQAAGY